MTRSRWTFSASFLFLVLSLAGPPPGFRIPLGAAPVSAEPLLRLQDYEPDELQVLGVEIPRKARVTIEAVGSRTSWSDDWVASAWLLDAATRRVVWSQEDSRATRDRSGRSFRRTQDEIDLPAGRYELYAWAGSSWSFGGVRLCIAGLEDLADLLHGRRRWHDRGNREVRRIARDCWVEISSDDLGKRDVREFDPTGEIPGALLRATRLGDEAWVQAGLTVERPVDLRVIAFAELPPGRRDPADGGWIVNAATRARVWGTVRRGSDHAGGAEKNRLYDDLVHLDPGRYVLCFGTDGSHAWGTWNATPPHDPMNWGVTIVPAKAADAAAVHVDTSYRRGEPLLDLTQAGDEDALERRFRLDRAADLQVYALGEWDEHRDEFADRGWIEKAGDGEVVWEMTHRNTRHAGGAEKNRLFDGVVHLDAGEYVALYETDDSHSYEDWNADAPFDREAWGLAIHAAPGTDAGGFRARDDGSRRHGALEPRQDHDQGAASLIPAGTASASRGRPARPRRTAARIAAGPVSLP